MEHRQRQLEDRISELENVVLQMNVFVFKLSSELTSLKSSQIENCSKSTDNTSQWKKTDLKQEAESYSITNWNFSSSSSSCEELVYSNSVDTSIPQYRGERDAGVIRAWLDRVESYFEAGHVYEDEKVLIATYNLRDAAYYWWRKNKTNTITWEEFRTMFTRAFMPGRSQAKFALMDVRQHGRPVREYTAEFRTILSRLTGVSEEDEVTYYVHGLGSNLRPHVDGRNPRTLVDAIRAAEMCELNAYLGEKV